MKKKFAGVLLGICLCLGNFSVLYAESAEEIEEAADTAENNAFSAEMVQENGNPELDSEMENFASDNNGSFSDEFDSGVTMEQDENGFYCGNQEEAKDMSAQTDGEKFLEKIPEDAAVVTLEVSDGSDITDTLNLVLQYMGQRASDEKPCTVIIPPGNYQISGTIRMYSNLTLCARGAVLTKSCTDKHVILRLGENVVSEGGYEGYRNITIEGGTWDLNYSIVENKEEQGGFVGFRIGHAQNIVVRDVTFLNNLKSHFLELAGVKNVLVTGCTFNGYWQDYEGGGQESIQLDACLDYIFPGYEPFDGAVCENVRIEKNIFENVFAGVGSHSMIYGHPYRNIVIQENYFHNVRKRAVWCLNYIDSAVEDNVMENVGGGVLVSSMYLPNTHVIPGKNVGSQLVSGNSIKRNQIWVSSTSIINGSKWKAYGIQVQGARVQETQSAASEGVPADLYKETEVIVSENTITGSGNGIRLILADNCKLMNNQLKLEKAVGFSNMGIYLSASSGNVINGNKISGCKNVGIYAYNGGSLNVSSTGNLIQENVISGTGGDGILIEANSTDTSVNKNYVLSGKKNGIIIYSSEQCQITENRVSDCVLDGIYLKNIGNAVIKSNKITDVKGRGLQVLSCRVKSLYRNAVSGSRKCGLYASGSVIKGNKKNRMENNGSTYAIYAKGCSGITSVKLPTSSKITSKSVKITGKAAGGKTLTVYAVTKKGSKKIGKGNITSKKKYSIAIKKQKKGTVLRFVLTDKYGNASYTSKKVK